MSYTIFDSFARPLLLDPKCAGAREITADGARIVQAATGVYLIYKACCIGSKLFQLTKKENAIASKRCSIAANCALDVAQGLFARDVYKIAQNVPSLVQGSFITRAHAACSPTTCVEKLFAGTLIMPLATPLATDILSLRQR